MRVAWAVIFWRDGEAPEISLYEERDEAVVAYQELTQSWSGVLLFRAYASGELQSDEQPMPVELLDGPANRAFRLYPRGTLAHRVCLLERYLELLAEGRFSELACIDEDYQSAVDDVIRAIKGAPRE
jgi:hypothetical protein